MGDFDAEYYSMCVCIGIAIVIEWKQAEEPIIITLLIIWVL
jgi:hypothetical protein